MHPMGGAHNALGKRLHCKAARTDRLVYTTLCAGTPRIAASLDLVEEVGVSCAESQMGGQDPSVHQQVILQSLMSNTRLQKVIQSIPMQQPQDLRTRFPAATELEIQFLRQTLMLEPTL